MSSILTSSIPVPVAAYALGTLLLIACLLGRLVASLLTKLKESNRIIDEQALTIEHQTKALAQITGGLDPGREMAREFGPGRKDLTAFFAEWGRQHLQGTDICEEISSR